MEKILLHVCCGPCATHSIKELMKEFDVVLFPYNPNIYPKDEYEKRLDAVKRVAEELNVEMLEVEYDHDDWLERVRGLEDEKEGGKRCDVCFEFRLKKTVEVCVKKGIGCFTTTLSISPHKNTKKINGVGKNVAGSNLRFIEKDFGDGFQKSVDISKELGLYRQKYCGCEFSIRKS